MLVLVVEDEPLVASALEWELKDTGHRILGPADSFEVAVSLCGEIRPDLALIDLNLREGGSGVDLCRWLRERHGTPCLFVTAHPARARAHRHLAWGVVRKPYDSTSLPRVVQVMAEMIEGRRPDLPPSLELFHPIGAQAGGAAS